MRHCIVQEVMRYVRRKQLKKGYEWKKLNSEVLYGRCGLFVSINSAMKRKASIRNASKLFFIVAVMLPRPATLWPAMETTAQPYCLLLGRIRKGGPYGFALSLILIPGCLWAQIPSSLGWYQIPNTAIRPLCPSYADIQGVEGCSAVVDSWSGGMFDTKRNRLIIFGGGHNAYYGNELYAVDLNANPIRTILVHDASHGTALSNLSSCPDAYSDGNPGSRHSYDGEWYLPNTDQYFVYGGAKAPCGFLSGAIFFYNPNTNTWAQQNISGSAPNPGSNGSMPYTAYDSVTGNLYEVESNGALFWSYAPGASSWTNLANAGVCNPLDETTVIDPGRRIYFCIGNGNFQKVSLNPPYTGSTPAGAGCSTLINTRAPGFTYDPVQKLMVGWAGGNTVYLYNPDTDSCSTVIYPNGPTTAPPPTGIYGKFQYSPASGVFVVVNSIDTNAYALRLTNGTADTTPPPGCASANGWACRIGGVNVSGGAGSIVSYQSFDVMPNINNGAGQQQYFAGNYNGNISIDCANASDSYSGACALKMNVPPGTGTDTSGSFYFNFSPDFSKQFGPGQEFYVQYKERLDPAMLVASNWPGGTDFKSDIISEGDTPASGGVAICSNSPGELVTQSVGGAYPILYHNCGSSGGTYAFTQQGYQPVQLGGIVNYNFLDQTYAGCPNYSGRGIPTTDPTCWNYVGNEWFTIQKHVKIGAFGQPNSVIETWISHQGQPAMLVTGAADAALVNDGSGVGTHLYGRVALLPYRTGLTGGLVNSTVWYDDLIVSTRRIPDPDVSAPNAPDSLSLSNVASNSITVNWRVNSQNGTAQDDAGFLVERCAGTPQTCFPNPQSGFSQIGTTATGASSYVDNTVASGTTYTYRVRGKNASGNSAYASAICFNGGTTCGGTAVASGSVVSTPPSITAQPQNAGITVGQSAGFSVTAAGSQPLSYQWQSKVSGAFSFTNISGATSASFTFINAQLTDSGAQFQCVVANNQGSAVSQAATLTVTNSVPDTIPPTVSITSPANGATVSGTITVSGTAADNVAVSNVQVSVDGGAYSATSGTTNWTFSLNTTTLSNASHTISAKATDTSGNVSTISSVSVTVNNASPPPSAPAITGALTASGTVGSAFSYQITASNSPASFNATGLPAGLSINTSNGLISGTPTTAGTSSVAISAANAGGTGTAALILTVNAPAPPAVSILPLSTTTLSGTVTLTASASSNLGIASVQFLLDGSNLGSPLTAPPFTLSWNTMQAAPGTHSLTAVATGIAGNKTISAPIMVTVVRGSDATPGLRSAVVYPNPAVKTDPTIRAFLGIVSSVEITIFDAAGRVVNSGSVSGAPTGISNGQYYYDYKWTGSKSSGIYFAVIHGKAADGSIIRARVKFAVIE